MTSRLKARKTTIAFNKSVTNESGFYDPHTYEGIEIKIYRKVVLGPRGTR
jgi:hypothetical protein